MIQLLLFANIITSLNVSSAIYFNNKIYQQRLSI